MESSTLGLIKLNGKPFLSETLVKGMHIVIINPKSHEKVVMNVVLAYNNLSYELDEFIVLM